ncbi:MAG: InlB B-repeat-containing protein, partial [Tissierellia bacterium]|nr:InlB B-repeat-containing protein [Tissierellia bacterium]
MIFGERLVGDIINGVHTGQVHWPNGTISYASINKTKKPINYLMLHSHNTGDYDLKRTLFTPKLEDIFTHDNEIIGKTKEGNWGVHLLIEKGKKADGSSDYIDLRGDSASTESTAGTGYDFKFTKGNLENQFPANTLKKDMRVKARNFRVSEFPSEFVETKVKALVNFDLNYEAANPKILERIAPENDKFLFEEGYEDKGFENPLQSGLSQEDKDLRAWPTEEETTRTDIADESKKLFFIEWNKDPLGRGDVFEKNTPVTEKTDVYAQWGHKLILDPMGGTFPGDSWQDLWELDSDGNLVRVFKTNIKTEAVEPIRESYTFVGWSKDRNANPSNWEENQFVPGLKTLQENITAYAVWKADIIETTNPDEAYDVDKQVKVEFYADEESKIGDSLKGLLNSTFENTETTEPVKYLAYILDKKADFIAIPIPEVTGKVGFTPKGNGELWQPTLPGERDTVMNQVYTAQYIDPELISHVNPDESPTPGVPSTHIRLTFHAGDQGTLSSKLNTITGNHSTLYIDVKKGLNWTQFKEAVPTVVANDGWKTGCWDPKLPEGNVLVENGDTEFTAVYIKEILDPEESAPSNYVKIGFYADENSKTGEPKKGTLSSTLNPTITEKKYIGYFVKNGHLFELIPVPKATAKTGFEVNANPKWTPELVTGELTEDKTYVVRYESNGIVPYEPSVPSNPTNREDSAIPEKDKDGDLITLSEYVIIAYNTDNNGTLKTSSEDTVGVDARSFLIRNGIRWNNDDVQATKPDVIAKDEYIFDKWELDIPTGGGEVVTRVMTAHFKLIDNIIPTTAEDSNRPSSKHVKIIFSNGENGEFVNSSDTKAYWVKQGSEIGTAQYPAPQIKANDEYRYDRWNENMPYKVTESDVDSGVKTLTAQYSLWEDIIPVTNEVSLPPSSKHVRVTFSTENNGEFTNQNVQTEFWVKKGVEIPESLSPEIKANQGFTHLGWDPQLAYKVKETDTDFTISAQYVADIVPVTQENEATAPSPEHFKVTFLAGNNGIFPDDSIPKAYWVKKDLKVSAINPRPEVTSNEGYSFKHWALEGSPETAYDFATILDGNITLVAQYEKVNYTIQVTGDTENALTVAGTAQMGDTVSITNSRPNDYKYTVKNDTTNEEISVSGGSFTMPASTVTITVEETEAKAFTLQDPVVTPVDNTTAVSAEEKALVTQAIKDANTSLPATASITVENDGKAIITFSDGSTKELAPEKTIREKASYTVTFNADGGTPVPDTQTVTEGEKATEPTAPTKTGYSFKHWALEGSPETAYD